MTVALASLVFRFNENDQKRTDKLNDLKSYVSAATSITDALEALGTGIVVKTANATPDTFAARTITGTANQISVANGNGVSANPTLSLPTTLITPGTIQATGTITADTSFIINGQATITAAAAVLDLRSGSTRIQNGTGASTYGTFSSTGLALTGSYSATVSTNVTGGYSVTDGTRTAALTASDGGTGHSAVGTYSNHDFKLFRNATEVAALTSSGLTLANPLALAYGGLGVALSDPGADRILFWDDSAGQVDWLSLGAGLSISGTSITATAGPLIGIQVITTTGAGTYTPTAGTNSIVFEMVGAGGGGGGAAAAAAAQAAVAQGGGGGGYVRHRLTANFSGASYSVGAKGTGGAAGNNNGTAGGNTTFTDTSGAPTTYTASGGGAGTGGASQGVPFTRNSIAGGGTTNGSVRMAGGGSVNGLALSTTQSMGGGGGNSQLGKGAPPVNIGGAAATATAGSNASQGYGGGGGGGTTTGGAGAGAAGGNGTDGILIIWEYS